MSDKPNIILKPVDADNWQDITDLELADGQEKFVAPNWYSILQALYDEDEMRGIYLRSDAEAQETDTDADDNDADDNDADDDDTDARVDTLVGFTMWTEDYDDREAFIARLMIDKAHQRKGYATAAMEIVLEDLRDNRDIDDVFISFVPENQAAKKLYEALGFEDTGEVEEGELVYKLNVE
jgi:diamine N-acetyltransferase